MADDPRPTRCTICAAPMTQAHFGPARLTCSARCRKARQARQVRRERQALVEALQAIESGAPRAHLVDVLTSALSA